MTSTTAAPSAHSVLSDAELIQSAFDTVCDMEEPLDKIECYARALILMYEARRGEEADVVSRLAIDIEELTEAVKSDRDKLFHALGRHEVEEAEGAAS